MSGAVNLISWQEVIVRSTFVAAAQNREVTLTSGGVEGSTFAQTDS